jgi:adenosine/AMP kinase
VDGLKPDVIESADDIEFRKKFLREIGYKFW